MKPEEIGFDIGAKFKFSSKNKFATAGSCFAQHFSKALQQRGGHIVRTEVAHPLHSNKEANSYDHFSARYGNIYTNRQLLELFRQALGKSNIISEYVRCDDSRFRDLLRPRSSPVGFSSVAEAESDRKYHLACVKQMMCEMDVFVFTMGLTEAWVNQDYGYVYPVCPGTVIGEFDSLKHQFMNFSFEECFDDIRLSAQLIHEVNPNVKILLTVSPVSLVATAENRSVVVSTIASKSKLRACADQLAQDFELIDYFPSYEMISTAPTQARFWANDMREVTQEGVDFVMRQFYKSRLPELEETEMAVVSREDNTGDGDNIDFEIRRLVDSECEEMFLDRTVS